MKARAKLENLNCTADKQIIVRNLSRIMNIRVLEVNIDSSTIDFLYSTSVVFEQAQRELWRIGFPIKSCALSGFEQNTAKKEIRVEMA
ncbi:MAG: hypothetical protein R3243_14590 [Arenibacter latericius]|nr:hypothetical protein [Arenibacter latericius]